MLYILYSFVMSILWNFSLAYLVYFVFISTCHWFWDTNKTIIMQNVKNVKVCCMFYGKPVVKTFFLCHRFALPFNVTENYCIGHKHTIYCRDSILNRPTFSACFILRKQPDLSERDTHILLFSLYSCRSPQTPVNSWLQQDHASSLGILEYAGSQSVK